VVEYPAQLLMQRALIADERQHPDEALKLRTDATSLAHAAGGNRILADDDRVAISLARTARSSVSAALRVHRDTQSTSRTSYAHE